MNYFKIKDRKIATIRVRAIIYFSIYFFFNTMIKHVLKKYKKIIRIFWWMIRFNKSFQNNKINFIKYH